MKKSIGLFILLVLLSLLSSCSLNEYQNIEKKVESGNFVLKDIAYNKKLEEAHSIYIQEDESYEPYLVIDGDYDGGVLLLRKYLLDEGIQYSEEQSHSTYGGYYPNSIIDAYLNTMFLSKFPQSLQDKILDTTISVANLETVGSGGGIDKTDNINRKIFLLSATELNIRGSMKATEGKPLAYYKKRDDLTAQLKIGANDAYWLRTAYLWDDIQAWVIDAAGKIGGASVSYTFSLRPAFCLEGNTAVVETDEIVEGRKVYVLKNP
jgi:hypothetical protein